jgi:Tol biopolymer transport system component
MLLIAFLSVQRTMNEVQAMQTPPAQSKECRMVVQVNQGANPGAPDPTVAVDPISKTAGASTIPFLDSLVSPDGQTAAQLVSTGQKKQIVLSVVPGIGNSRLIGPPNGDVRSFAWAPDSRMFAFTMLIADGSQNLYVLPTQNAGAPVRLTNSPTIDLNPVWSSDGQSIYFASKSAAGTSAGIFRLALNGGQAAGTPQPVLASNAATALTGVFDLSPDQDRVAYATLVDGKTQILIHTLGSRQADDKLILTSAAPITDLAWAPGADQIAYIVMQKLHLINVDGSGDQALVETLNLYALRWVCRDAWIEPSGAGGPARR